MVGRTVFEMDEGPSSRWAAREEAYQQLVSEGVITPDGRQEMAASQATRIVSVDRKINQIDALMGTNIRASVAYFVPARGWGSRRTFSQLAAPTLGSTDRLRVDAGKVAGIQPTLTEAGRRSAQRILNGLDLVLALREEGMWVQGRIGELRAA